MILTKDGFCQLCQDEPIIQVSVSINNDHVSTMNMHNMGILPWL